MTPGDVCVQREGRPPSRAIAGNPANYDAPPEENPKVTSSLDYPKTSPTGMKESGVRSNTEAGKLKCLLTREEAGK